MKATEYTIELTVTVNTIVMEGEHLNTLIDEMNVRINDALAGHRTNKRLADWVKVSSRILWESSREIPE